MLRIGGLEQAVERAVIDSQGNRLVWLNRTGRSARLNKCRGRADPSDLIELLPNLYATLAKRRRQRPQVRVGEYTDVVGFSLYYYKSPIFRGKI